MSDSAFDYWVTIASPRQVDLAGAMLMAWQRSPTLSVLPLDTNELIKVVEEFAENVFPPE